MIRSIEMRHLFYSLFLTFSILHAQPADKGRYRVFGIAPFDVLWIHLEPDYLSKQVGYLPFYAHGIQMLECTNTISFAEFIKLSQKEQRQLKYHTKWCKVHYGQMEGWVNANFLREDFRGKKLHIRKK